MACNIGEKRSKVILLVYLILVLIGSSAISAGEALYLEQSSGDSMSQEKFSSTDHNIDWLARVTIRKDNGSLNSPQRNRLLRIFTFAGIIAIAMYLVRTNLKIIKNDNIPIIKNSIPMKLRT